MCFSNFCIILTCPWSAIAAASLAIPLAEAKAPLLEFSAILNPSVCIALRPSEFSIFADLKISSSGGGFSAKAQGFMITRSDGLSDVWLRFSTWRSTSDPRALYYGRKGQATHKTYIME